MPESLVRTVRLHQQEFLLVTRVAKKSDMKRSKWMRIAIVQLVERINRGKIGKLPSYRYKKADEKDLAETFVTIRFTPIELKGIKRAAKKLGVMPSKILHRGVCVAASKAA